jgi:hypothetical protein
MGILLVTPSAHRNDLGSVIDMLEESCLKNQNSLEQSLEKYLEQADELAVKVMNLETQMLCGWDQVCLIESVKDVTEKCSAYRVAKRAADHCRDLNILSAEEAQTETETRLAFAAACKALDDKWTELMLSPIACGCDASGNNCSHDPGHCQNHAMVALSSGGETEPKIDLGMCRECWDSGGVFRAPAAKKPARRGAVA